MKENSARVTIGILSYRRGQLLKACVNSLFRCTREPFLLHIINQGYMDEELSRYYENLDERNNVKITKFQRNVGPLAGRKILAER